MGVSVSRRSAFDDIGYVYLRAVKIYRRQYFIQQLSRRAYKGYALQILLLSRSLAYEHYVGIFISGTYDHIGPGFPKSAFFTAVAGALKDFPAFHKNTASFSGYSCPFKYLFLSAEHILFFVLFHMVISHKMEHTVDR